MKTFYEVRTVPDRVTAARTVGRYVSLMLAIAEARSLAATSYGEDDYRVVKVTEVFSTMKEQT